MNKTFSKIVSYVLTLVIIVTSLPVNAFAEVFSSGVGFGNMTMYENVGDALANQGEPIPSSKFELVLPEGVTGTWPAGFQVLTGPLTSSTCPRFEGATFDYAEVNGNKITSAGAFRDMVYYSGEGQAADFVWQVLEGNQKIKLHYKEFIQEYDIKYNYASFVGNDVKVGPSVVEEGNGFTFEVTVARGYVAKVSYTMGEQTTNLPNLEPKGDNGYPVSQRYKQYSVANVTADCTVTVVFEEVEEFSFRNEAYNWWNGNAATSYGHGATFSPASGTYRQDAGGFTWELTAGKSNTGNYFWELNGLSINGEPLNIPYIVEHGTSYTEGSATTTLSTGTVVSIKTDVVGWGTGRGNRQAHYVITVSNAKEDIIITYGNFRASTHKEIMPEWLEGVKLQARNNAGDWVDAPVAIPIAYKDNANKGQLRIQLLPGYSNLQIVAQGTSYTASAPDKDGWRYIDFNDNHFGNESFLHLRITATPLEYHVAYTSGEVAAADANLMPTDGATYSVIGHKIIMLDASTPIDKTGEHIFKGWKLVGTDEVYNRNDMLTLADVVQYASTNGTITFEAQWDTVESADVRPYMVEFHIRDKKSETYHLHKTVGGSAAAGSTIFFNDTGIDAFLEGEYAYYTLDEKQSNRTLTISPTGENIIKLYFYPETGSFTVRHVEFGTDQLITRFGTNGEQHVSTAWAGESHRVDYFVVTDDYEYVYFTSNPLTTFTVEANKDTVVTIYYRKINYTVTYEKGANGTLEGNTNTAGSIVHNNLHYGDDTPTPPNVNAANGFYFVGWKPTVASTVTGNATYVAQYAETNALSIMVRDKTVTYNGQEQQGLGFPTGNVGNGGNTEYAVQGLKPGHTVSMTYTPASGTDVRPGQTAPYAGSYTDLKVWEGTKDVTSEYGNKISVLVGALTITPRAVTITSADGQKVYDGQPLTNNTVTVTSGSFADGEGATYKVTGSQTDVGSSPNIFEYTLKSGTKPENYKITKNQGTLTVDPITTKIVVTANSASKTYDGSALVNNGYTYTGTLAEGDELVVEVVGSQTDAGDGDNVVTSVKVMRGQADVTGNYKFGTHVNGTLTVNPRPVTLTSANASKTYDGAALTKNEVTVTNGSFVSGESLTYTYTGSQTDAGESANSFSYAAGENTKLGNYTITKVEGKLTVNKREVTLTSATDSKVYDGNPLTAKKVTVTDGSFADGEGVQSYNVTGSRTDEGESANTFEYTLQENTKAGNYTITKVEGKLTVTPITTPIIVTANSKSKTYDGTALTDDGYSYTKDVLLAGDVLTAVVKGTQTDAGESANVVESYKVMRGDTDVTKNYTFGASVNGKLTVNKREVTLTSATDSKVYDGSPLTAKTVTVTDGSFVDGEGVQSYNVTGSRTDEGESANTFEYTLQENTKAGNYTITKVEGKLTVTPITTPIIVTANSNSKTYDGTPLTDAGYNYTQDVLLEGDELTAVVEGSQKDAGNSANVVTSYKVTRTSDGEEVTDNYTFGTSVNGTLLISPRTVTLTSATASKMYDGAALTNNNVTVGGQGFVNGEGASYTVTGSQLNAGGSANTFSYTLNGNAKAGNYTITKVEGTLTVSQRNVTLTSASATRMYDGTALTNRNVTVGGDGFAAGEGATYNVTGSQTNFGNSANAFTYTLNGNPANYNITTTTGTLSVTRRPVTVFANNKTKLQGEADPAFDARVTGVLPGDEGAIQYTLRRDPGETAGKYAIIPSGNAVQGNYAVGFQNGTLTITDSRVTIHYVYEGNAALNKQEVMGAKVGSAILDISAKILANTVTGYRVKNTTGLPLTVSENNENNHIWVYYEPTNTPNTPPERPTPLDPDNPFDPFNQMDPNQPIEEAQRPLLVTIFDLETPTGASMGGVNVGDCAE